MGNFSKKKKDSASTFQADSVNDLSMPVAKWIFVNQCNKALKWLLIDMLVFMKVDKNLKTVSSSMTLRKPIWSGQESNYTSLTHWPP